MRHLIAYDVTDDNVRARLAALLAVWGDRIQKSVFECTLAQDDLEELMARVTNLIDLSTDSVHVVPICQGCEGSRRLVGQAGRAEESWCWVI